MKEKKEIPLSAPLLCLAFLFLIMAASVFWLNIPTQISLLISMCFTVCVLLFNRYSSWEDIASYIEHGGKIAIMPTLTLMIIGILIGTWVASGTVPMIIYWGLRLINPSFFLVTTCVICMITALASGSSWSTAGTVGAALIAVGGGLGVNPAMTAGAIVSGAYFGDKMSPMSDTTNLAPAVAEADLFDHIRSMVYTTTPAIIISLVAYGLLGLQFGGSNVDMSAINLTTSTLASEFNLNILTLVPLVVVLYLTIKKFPAIPALLIAAAAAAVLAILLQGETVTSITKIMDSGYVSATGYKDIDRLLSRGGLQNMLSTVGLGILGMTYGAIMEKSGLLKVFLQSLKALTKTGGSLILVTIISTLILNASTASQALAIIVTGRMFLPEFKERNLLPQTLSRTLEDGGTLFSPLVPWSLCGVFMSGTLGVSVIQYLPYAMFCWLCPIIAVIYGYINKFQWKTGEIASKKTYAEA